MNCVILQPSYIPWRGYFDQIRRADTFVFLDSVQYDARGWRNRNRVLGTDGRPRWLTIPVQRRGVQQRGTPIHRIPIAWNEPWARKHRTALQLAYARAPFYERYAPLLDEIYARSDELLADFTIGTTRRIAQELGLGDTRYLRSSELEVRGSKTELLLEILRRVGADRYISGPSARDYLDEALLREAGIEVEYMTYDYPDYPQLGETFHPDLSILDVLLMTGPEAGERIRPRDGARG